MRSLDEIREDLKRRQAEWESIRKVAEETAIGWITITSYKLRLVLPVMFGVPAYDGWFSVELTHKEWLAVCVTNHSVRREIEFNLDARARELYLQDAPERELFLKPGDFRRTQGGVYGVSYTREKP